MLNRTLTEVDMERLTKSELANGFPVCYPKSDSGLPILVTESNPYTEIIKKLKQYEDLEEQGKLLKLPCMVDDEVWYIDKYADLYTEIVRGVVDGYLWYRSCGFALNVVWDKPIMGHFGYKRKEVPFYEIGKTVFLTQEEAESVLKEVEHE